LLWAKKPSLLTPGEKNSSGGFFVSDSMMMSKKYTLDDIGGGGFLPEDPPNKMENQLLLNLSNDKIEVAAKIYPKLPTSTNPKQLPVVPPHNKTVMMMKMTAMLIGKMATNQRRHSIL
jgi:hypothetical protein